MWVYVGESAPAGATAFSYESESRPHLVALADKCQSVWLDGQKAGSGMTCLADTWTHITIVYTGAEVVTYKNAIRATNIARRLDVNSGGMIVLGQDNVNAAFPTAAALAPGQVSAPQLFNSALTEAQVVTVKSGALKGNVLSTLANYKVHGFANFDTNELQS